MQSERLSAAPLVELVRAFGTRLCRDEPLARHCTLGVGGPCDLFLSVQSRNELETAATLARAAGLPLLVLGTAANVLPSDAGFRGMVIRNVARRVEYTHDGSSVTADSGVVVPALALRLARAGLGGLEWGAGIPGTVGGVTVNNAGAHGGCIADVLISTLTLDAHGLQHQRAASELAYAYRRSALKSCGGHPPPLGEVVLASTFRVHACDQRSVARQIKRWAEERTARQPLKSASAGSFFQNPPGDFAGRLIEAVGLKGARLGGAQVSPLHANFLINAGGASARDVFALGQLVRETVREQTGVVLAREVEVVGDWSATTSS